MGTSFERKRLRRRKLLVRRVAQSPQSPMHYTHLHCVPWDNARVIMVLPAKRRAEGAGCFDGWLYIPL